MLPRPQQRLAHKDEMLALYLHDHVLRRRALQVRDEGPAVAQLRHNVANTAHELVHVRAQPLASLQGRVVPEAEQLERRGGELEHAQEQPPPKPLSILLDILVPRLHNEQPVLVIDILDFSELFRFKLNRAVDSDQRGLHDAPKRDPGLLPGLRHPRGPPVPQRALDHVHQRLPHGLQVLSTNAVGGMPPRQAVEVTCELRWLSFACD
mmetsp:Transcript_15541/g.37840  ORF Transcript_15541/g.37840 Transcript_15541/m.37840 type:complete len:208 (+) Transcript_15541:1063-1686(+)